MTGRFSVTYCVTRPDMLRAVRELGVVAAVVEACDADGRSHAGTVRAVVNICPRVPVFVVVRPMCHDVRTLIDYAHAGVRDVLMYGASAEAQLSVLETRTRSSVADSTTLLLSQRLPEYLAPLISYCIANASAHPTAAELAEVLGLSRRGLTKRLCSAGLPAPKRFLTWCRLALAVSFLVETSETVDSIAGSVGFASGNALWNALRRHTATTAGQIRASRDIRECLDQITAMVRGSRPTGRTAG